MFDVFFLQLMATVSYQQQKREGGGQQILFCLLIQWLSKYEIKKINTLR